MRRLAPLLLLPLLLSACSGDDGGSSRPTVVVGAYPFAWLVQQVGGPDVDVVNLAEPGVEPHDLELTPRQVAQVKEADLVLRLDGFQPALDDLDTGEDIGAAEGLDLIDGEEGSDPHVWLDPLRMNALAAFVANRLEGLGVTGAQARLASVQSELEGLDGEVKAQLTSCRTRQFVTSHEAFAYLADRYELVQRGIAGLSPDQEPSPKRLAEVAAFAKKNRVTTIFFETLVSPKLAETVADEVGAKTGVLDPIESVEGSDDYPTVLRRNAAALHEALGCA